MNQPFAYHNPELVVKAMSHFDDYAECVGCGADIKPNEKYLTLGQVVQTPELWGAKFTIYCEKCADKITTFLSCL